MLLGDTADRAVGYILSRLNENPSVEEVAEHCHFSKYHFSRLFKAQTGESPYAFIRRLRLEESAFRLKVEPGRTVTDIGYDCGYSPSNYSWAFRQRFGTDPVHFRRAARSASFGHSFCHLPEEEAAALLSSGGGIQVRPLPDIFVVYERRIGNYHELGRLWQDFFRLCRPWRTPASRFLVRSFDDPAITNPEACLYDVCMSVLPDCPLPNVSRIPGGQYLVLPYRGPVKNIFAAYQALFNLWLPQTGWQLHNQFSFDLYHRMNGPGDVQLDICLPLARAAFR